MLTSKTCQLATRALILLALEKKGLFTSVARLSKQLKVSNAFLTKVLQPLTQEGILISIKGTHGGVKLNRDARQISMKEIVDIYDGRDVLETCALGIPNCTIETPCAFHYKWSPIRDKINDAFEQTSIQDLADSQLKNDSPLA